ncbi:MULTISPECIES: hypothetical protein [unclassified Haladaptatus]|uniref:hypothetical protein n=1 Tax=unclassified Haladaptatus TaxID=2622732 RepID=UPI00209C553A|nr:MULTISPECIES: hypothetical protein [unclassified Haladaptatus]MCO8244461.1 hypothetical protein [Haladaptatus sp. AB643]MCO8253917.1 hypothetical protein [Haladaptatus sp. AB618]
MQRERRHILTLAIVCLLILGSGGVAATTYDQPSRDQPTITTHETVRVEFANDSTVIVHGNVERVGIGTTWSATDGAATSYFQYGPMNGTTRLDVPKEGKRTAISYVTVYSGGNMTPILTVQNPSKESTNATNTSNCHVGPSGESAASSVRAA